MTILITGGTGRTGTALAKKLHAAVQTVLLASRSGSAPEHFKGVKFDWLDPSTFENPFKVDASIDKVYLLGPRTLDPLATVKPFIDLAISKGVKRFVVLSATSVGKGGPAYGKVHEYLDGIKGIDYGIVRPTWFFENLDSFMLPGIRDRDEIVTATEDGKIPFVAVDDIAQLAFNFLTAEKIEANDLLVIGPDLLSYDEVAELFSKELGRKITHRRITVPEFAEMQKGFGLPEHMAKMLAALQGDVAAGKEAKVVEVENKYVGKSHLADWIKERKAVWSKQ